MNKESVFALRFVMKDFAKMRKGVEQINKNLEQMQKNANKASGGMNKLNTSMGKAIRTIGKFALAYFALSKVISTTFKKANETIQIDLMAQSAGVAADKIGKLGKALRIYGGDAKSAGSAYMSLTDIIGGAQHGMGISEDVQRVNAMYGIGFNYGNISQDALMTQIATRMHALRKEGDQWAINQIAKAYGIDTPMANFLAEQGANWSSKANRYQFEKVSKSETQRLIEAQDNLEVEIAKLGNVLIEHLPALVKGITELARGVNAIVDRFHLDKGSVASAGTANVTDESYINYAKDQLEKGKITQEKFNELVMLRTTSAVPWANEAIKNKSLANYWKDIIEQSENPFAEMAHIMSINKSVKFNSLPLATGQETWVDVGGQKVKVFLTLTDKTSNGVRPSVAGASIE